MLDLSLDTRQLAAMQAELGATDAQVRYAFGRALRRTAAALRRVAAKGFKTELGVKRAMFVRRRLRVARLRGNGGDGIQLWFGLNDLPVSALAGRMTETGTGATFRGKAGQFDFPKGFVRPGRYNGRQRSIFYRQGDPRFPLAEATAPIKDKMDAFIEDRVFVDVEAIFWRAFEHDLNARVKYGVGRRD